ncbi:uncharacterized protein TNCV_3488951 [Trichonephila clavipes]|nr:uncharacterized protein TNCV_3488951 [Trichonephila clavipes]
MTRSPSHDFRNTNHSTNNQFIFRNRQENWRDTRVETRYHDTNRPQRESNRFGGQGVGDNRRFDSRRRSDQSNHIFNNHGGRQGSSRNGGFRGRSKLSRQVEVEKLAYQLNEEAERTERPIRRLSKVMYGSTCADMQVDVMGKCLSSIKHVVGVRSVFLAKRLNAV